MAEETFTKGLELEIPHYIMGVDLAEVGTNDTSVIAVFQVGQYGAIRFITGFSMSAEMNNKMDQNLKNKLWEEQIEKFAKEYRAIKILKETK